MFILLVVTAIVWMTQSLQRVEILVEYGQGFGVFLFLSLLIIPSLLALIIPFALFGSTIYALHRLHSDSEIAVMFAAGVSKWRLSAPILFIAFVGALATFYVNVDMMPRSYRVLKQSIADIRSDFASSIIRGGEFNRFVDGFTIYVDDARPGGQFTGLLVSDYRNEDDPKIYMAERAILIDGESGPMLFLRNGNVQRISKETKEVDIIRFEELAVNIENYRDNTNELVLELTERYPHELLNPDLSKPYDRANAGKLIAEGHSRYAAPLYAFAYVLIGLYAMIGGPYNRRGYILRAVAASVAIFAIRILGFITQGFVETSGGYWMLYAIPGSVIIVFTILLFAPSSFRKRKQPVEGQS